MFPLLNDHIATYGFDLFLFVEKLSWKQPSNGVPSFYQLHDISAGLWSGNINIYFRKTFVNNQAHEREIEYD